MRASRQPRPPASVPQLHQQTSEMDKPGPAILKNGLFWATSYAFISILITLTNKAVLSSYHFDCSMTLTCLQGLVTVIALEAMKRAGLIDFPAFNFATARKVAPLSFVFIAYVVISLISLGRVNVPMFTALRRLTIVFVMIEEYFLLNIIPSRAVLGSVVVMCLGAAIAAYKDLAFDITSYFYLLLTNLFTSLYTVFINVVKKDTKLNNWAMLYYSNVSSMPFLVLLAWYTGDIQRAVYYPYHWDLLFQINLQLSIFLAFTLNVCTFFSSSVNSARTQTVVGQLKNFVAFLLGLVLFDDYIYDPINFVGLLVGFAGGVLYGYISYVEKQQQQNKTPASAALPASGSATPAVTAHSPGGEATGSSGGGGGSSAFSIKVDAGGEGGGSSSGRGGGLELPEQPVSLAHDKSSSGGSGSSGVLSRAGTGGH